MLKKGWTLYNDKNELRDLLLNIDALKNQENWKNRVTQFSPETVMKKFHEVFIA
jgi:hypothetical protein